jgi:RHS repeat-associated protein
LVANADGTKEETCTGLPFGDGPPCTGTGDPSPQHFTGKERDTESNNDYFGARYYSNNTGRFLSPDPAGIAFSNPANPQSWNLYSYVLNNPLGAVDPDGRECVWDNGSFDSATDAQTGNAIGCGAAGGTYYEPSTFNEGNGRDWSASPNAGLAAEVAAGQALAASLPSTPDPSQATWGNTSTNGTTTTINFGGSNWQTTQVGTGTHPFRDNNPGDMMVAGGFAGNHGSLGNDGRIAVFPTADTGSNALDALLHSPNYSSLTVADTMAKFAPPNENDTAAYQQFLQNVVGVSGNAPLSSLSPAQFSAFERGIAQYEGFNAAGGYSVTTTSVIKVP